MEDLETAVIDDIPHLTLGEQILIKIPSFIGTDEVRCIGDRNLLFYFANAGTLVSDLSQYPS